MRGIGWFCKGAAFAAFVAAAGSVGVARADSSGAVTPVSGFDVERYLGLWHEIASIPNWFQEDCVASTTATYGVAEDIEGVTVLNACLEEDGSRAEAKGRARFTGPSDEAALEVTFVEVLGFWLWPLSGDYIVIAIDPDYRWTAVGHPSRDYGWILAREESLARETINEIASHFKDAGYDTCTLLMSPKGPGDTQTPLCELDQ